MRTKKQIRHIGDGKRRKKEVLCLKLDVGDVVRICDTLDHDSRYSGQIGVIYKYDGCYNGEHNYYVVAYDSYRFWACGFCESELRPLGFRFEKLIDAYAEWLSSDCWKNTDHRAFKMFIKSLKTIRKKYRAIVKERIGDTNRVCL